MVQFNRFSWLLAVLGYIRMNSARYCLCQEWNFFVKTVKKTFINVCAGAVQ